MWLLQDFKARTALHVAVTGCLNRQGWWCHADGVCSGARRSRRPV